MATVMTTTAPMDMTRNMDNKAIETIETCKNAQEATEDLDPILQQNPSQYRLFPIKHNDLWNFYLTAQNSFWVAQELKLDTDLHDWNNVLNDDERYYIKHILAFFANADAIVNENLLMRFEQEVQYPEAQYFYRFQGAIEQIHSIAYATFIETYVSDPQERDFLHNAVVNVPCVKEKADWAIRWIQNDKASFGERLLAFACMEGIFFSGSFAAIFWLRKKNVLKGLIQGNTLISRDEGLHQQFACHIYRHHLDKCKPSRERAEQIVREACELEKKFQIEALPCALLGINSESMGQYIEYCSDFLLNMIGLAPIYKVANPFDFMQLISLDPSVSFFEVVSTSYSMGASDREFSTDAEF